MGMSGVQKLQARYQLEIEEKYGIGSGSLVIRSISRQTSCVRRGRLTGGRSDAFRVRLPSSNYDDAASSDYCCHAVAANRQIRWLTGAA